MTPPAVWADINISQLARDLNISREAIYRWKRSATGIPAQRLLQIEQPRRASIEHNCGQTCSTAMTLQKRCQASPVLTRNDAAWDLWQRGLTVLPAHPVQKSPLVRWQRYQVEDVDEETMQYWCSSSRYDGCNWALVTGKEFCVVDADSPQAIQWVTETSALDAVTGKDKQGQALLLQNKPTLST